MFYFKTSTQKFEFGYSKLKKKKRVDVLIESQKGSIDRFIDKNIGNGSLNEQVNNVEIDENENREVLVNEIFPIFYLLSLYIFSFCFEDRCKFHFFFLAIENYILSFYINNKK